MAEKEQPEIVSRFNDDSQTLDIVQDGLSFLLDNVENEADTRAADKLVVPLATKAAMLKLKRLMSWAVLGHDGVIDNGNKEKPLEYLRPDPDPQPILIDSWARGMVPTRVIKAEDKAAKYRTLGGEEASASPRSQSASSFVSSNTGTSRSGTSRGRKSQYGGGGSRPGTSGSKLFEAEEDDPTGQIIEMEDEFEAIDFGLGGLSLDQLLKKDKINKDAEEDPEEEERDMFEVQQEEIDAAIKELPKGKKYVIDREGHVIPLTSVNASKLPPHQVNPNTKVTNFVPPPAVQSSRGGTRQGTGGTRTGTAQSGALDGDSLMNEVGSEAEGKREKKVIRVAGARMMHEGDGLFKPSHSLRDILSTGGSIVPTSGVTLKVDGQPRIGPEVPSVPGRMSEKEYKGRRAKADGSRPMSSAVPEGDPSLLLGAQAFGGDSVDQPPLNPDMTQQTQMRQELQYKIPDIDPLEGGRMRGSSLEKSSVEAGTIDPSVDDGTYQEVIDTSRGKGFAQLPEGKNPNTRLFSHDTTHTGTPKDRDLPVNQKRPSQRTKQIAPPPGQVSAIGSDIDMMSPTGVRQAGASALSPQGSVNSGSRSQSSAKSGKVGVMRTKGRIKNEKPHIAKQIF